MAIKPKKSVAPKRGSLTGANTFRKVDRSVGATTFQGKGPNLGGQGATGGASSLAQAARRRATEGSAVDPSTIALPDAGVGPAPEYDPNALDAQARGEISDAELGYNRTEKDSGTTYQRRLAATGTKRPQLDLQLSDDTNQNVNDFASRGLLRSGLKAVASGRLKSAYADAIGGLDRENTYAGEDYRNALFNAAQSRDSAIANAKTGAAQRAANASANLPTAPSDTFTVPTVPTPAGPVPQDSGSTPGVGYPMGPWDAPPNINQNLYSVYKDPFNGKWYAMKRETPLASGGF